MTDSQSGRWRRIEDLYNEALELDAADRDRFLARACGGDDALRREVRSLLDYESAADRFLERPAVVEAARSIASETRPPLTGRRIAGYDVTALIGAGGMGEVYRARDGRLGREVAFKVLEPTIAADPDYRRRFEHEAQSASALNHPNIVTIYTVAEEDEVTFITMELVQGETLRHLMAAPLSVQTVLDLSVQLAAALSAAHALGIVHRDLKPENVMVTADGLVKVLDFGLAKREGVQTDHGTTVGTLAYMSPEQALGQPVGPASDQFALGAIVYEMLTRQHAFERESRIETLEAIVSAEPPPIHKLNARAPAALRQIVARCLSKRPDGRYPNTRDLELALRNAREEIARQPTRRQLLWIGAGAAATAIAGSATWMLWPPHSLAVLPFANAANNDAAEYLCTGLTQTLIARMNHLPLAVKSFSLVSHFARSPSDPRAIGRQLGVENVVTGSVAVEGTHLLVTAALIDVATGAQLWTQRYDQLTASFFKLWDDLATAIVDDGLHLRLTRDERRELLSRPTDNVEAFDLFLRGGQLQFGYSEEDFIAARPFLKAAIEKDGRFAEAWLMLAANYSICVLENYMAPSDAWPHVDDCLAHAKALKIGLANLNVVAAQKIFFSDWDWAGADRAWQIAESVPDRELQPGYLVSHALAAWALRDVRQALALIRRARLVDPLSPMLLLHESSYLLYGGDADEAASRCLSVIDTHPSPGDEAAAYFMLAEVRRKQGRFAEAIAARRKAHALRDDSDDDLDAALSSAVGKDGYLQIERTAVERLELRTLERRRTLGEYASPTDFARAFAQLGENDQAFEYLNQALHEHSPGLVFLNVDRAWEAIRSDPRFAGVVKQVRLPS
jgi:serine/threonine protein kinase/tetratricopeptide (TPR) repeat protein